MSPETLKKNSGGNISEGWVFPVALGAIFACGTNAASSANLPLDEPYFYAQCLLFAVLFLLIFRWGYALLEKIGKRTVSNRESQKKGILQSLAFEYQASWKARLRDALRIFITWLPYLILMYPGVLYWDTGDQVAQFFGISAFGQEPGQIWDHHPFFDTYLYSGFIWLGRTVFGSYNVGIFLYSIVQYAFVTITIACWMRYLKEKGLGRLPLKACTLFFCFFPIFPIMFASMSKDITHAAFFLAWVLLFLRLVDSKLELFKNPKFLVEFLIISLCASMSKKMGMYIIVFSLLVLILGKFKALFKAIAVAVCVFLFVVISVALPKYFYPRANIVPGGAQAAFVMPIELLGRAAYAYPEDISDSARASVDSFLVYSWDQISNQYNPYIADPVTGYGLRDGGSTADFLKTWLKVGMRHPLTYVNGFFSLESGWITFSGTNKIRRPEKPYKQYPVQIDPTVTTNANKDTFGKLVPAKSENWAQRIVSGIVKTLKTTPVINVLCYVAVWTSMIPTFVLYVLWRRRGCNEGGSLFRFAPYLVSVASLFVYPISLQVEGDKADPSRYMFHTLLLAPIAFGMLCFSKKKDSVKKYV